MDWGDLPSKTQLQLKQPKDHTHKNVSFALLSVTFVNDGKPSIWLNRLSPLPHK